MKKKLKEFIQRNIFPILLVSLTIVLCIANFRSGTWLSGWDTLHPEFNFSLNIKRAFSGVWMEHQGLGAVASQAHPAEIPRLIILFISSFILPVSFLRYFYFFLCLIFGPLGVYFFLERIIFKSSIDLDKKIFSFLGALFYLLNLGTLQHFYVPLEMFATHFTSFGWLILFSTQYLETKKKKYLWFFSITTLLATPMAHTATLFYVYFLGLLIYLSSFILLNQSGNKLLLLKRSLILILVTLIINSFWLLPNLYFIFSHGSEVIGSKIHRLFTYEAISQGRIFANPKDMVLIKNFLFNWGELINGKSFGPLLDEWQKHLAYPLVSAIGYLFFAFIIFGFIFSLLKKDGKQIVFIPLLLISYFFLIVLNPSLEKIYLWLTKIPFLHEALRFPFTKFSIILIFTYAIFFAYGLNCLGKVLIERFRRKKKIILSVFLVIVSSLLIIFMWPAFLGNFISPSMKIKIPNEYFQLFKWSSQQEDGRVLKLPLHTFWGWNYHDWGYQGAGFTWFGIKQPTLDREFDRWNSENEESYQELSYALYSKNLSLFNDLLAKYQIKYLLLDKSIIAPEQEKNVLFFDETEKLLSSNQNIELIKEFGFIKIYRFNNLNNQLESYPELINFENPPENLKNIVEEKAIGYDTINFDNFLMTQPLDYQINLKNLDLKPELCGETGQSQIFGLTINSERSLTLTSKNAKACTKSSLEKIVATKPTKNFLLEITLDQEGEQSYFCLAKWKTSDCLLGTKENNRYYYQFSEKRELKNYELRFILDTENLSEQKQSLIKNFKIKTYNVKKLITKEDTDNNIDNIDISSHKLFYSSLKEDKKDTFSFPELSHNQSYALIMKAENKSGLPLRFCLTNYTSKHCDLYEDLKNGQNIFFIPPTDKDGQGYDLNLSNYGIGPIKSINYLESVKIIPLDYEFIEKKENPKEKYITNNQAYEKNWRAYEYQKPFSLKSLGSPTKINGWENGWLLKKETKGQIIFFFLPQLLEYFGFFLILVLIVFIAIF